MHGNRDGTGVLVFDHHMVATLHTIQAKSKSLQGPHGLLAIHVGNFRHLANSDELLKRPQPCSAKRNLLTVGFH